MMRRGLAARSVGLLAAGVLASAAFAGGAASAAGPATLYVSPAGSSGAADSSCGSAAYSTITGAVGAANSGDTIIVCPGMYKESVSINVSLTLIGLGATIDASGLSQGVVFMGPNTAGSALSGFTIMNAQNEGVYADGTTALTIQDNRIVGNDLACQPQTSFNDCGEGLHLDAVTNSRITGNYLAHNSGGILLTDGIPSGSTGAGVFGFTTQYSGPASGNLIADNTAVDNVWDCGITLPSHNSLAFNLETGQPNASAGGVFNNTIVGNIAVGNGTADGGGAGILVAAPFPGTAAYNNVVEGNRVDGNGLPGVTIHSHAPGQDVNGNQIIDNVVGTNALTGNAGKGPGDSDFGATGTIGILVASAVDTVTGTVISGNVVQNNQTGIWTTTTVNGDFSGNHFAHDAANVAAH